ncbi:MAG: heterodisulfide reductase-related iron-sulfur binding cluster [Arenicellales bacterium]|jgi:heterodisulfide reductase subunit B|nr:heterodisulfide reductase-related iron-sulfur binding cluster [Arenicellales bacterium]
MDAVVEPTAEPLSNRVLDHIGENIFRCFQCLKCSAGCPLADEFDLMPNQIMRSLQLGDAEVLKSRAIWLCSSCYTCATRCPQGIDVTGVMDALRMEAHARGVTAAIPEIDRFNLLFLRFVHRFGRLPELLFLLAYNLLRGQPLRDMALGWRMIKRGKLKLLPRFAHTPKTVQVVERPRDKVAYFPGCAAHSSAVEYDLTARTSAAALEIELIEPPGWTCCGAGAAHASDRTMAHEMPMRTMATIERMGIDTVTSPCSNCFARLKVAEHSAVDDASALDRVKVVTGHAYQGSVKVQHLLDTLLDRAGLATIAQRVRRPLAGLRVACYYGCLITRPSQVTGADNPEYPMKMDNLLQALGAETVGWSYKTDCCGASLSVTQTPLSLKMSRKVVVDAQECGAEAVATMCPMCHLNLDARQPEMELETPIPILQATQFMSLAFGFGAKGARLGQNIVDPRPLLGLKNLLD